MIWWNLMIPWCECFSLPSAVGSPPDDAPPDLFTAILEQLVRPETEAPQSRLDVVVIDRMAPKAAEN
jgi:hypothetical protein